jgi:outer membrane immunogenic protein
MKKLLVIASITFFALTFANNVQAQEAVKNRLGFFLAVASGDIDEVGIGGIGEFKVAKKVTISPQFILYFPEDRGPYDVNFLEVNVNANYYFYNKDIFEFYGFGGLNFTRWHTDWDDNRVNDNSDVEIGLNVGGGINFEVNKSFVPFSEIRATIGDFDQIVISAGLKFNLR